jgi:SpoVK/Ycf46/Vps4 family AAA+-type ATPase
MNRADYEKALLSDPFDTHRRVEYAQLLLAQDAAADALVQFELLCKQHPGTASHQVGASQALMKLGDVAQARLRYQQAQGLSGFTAVESFEHTLALASEKKAPHLTAIEGGRAVNVVSLAASTAKRIGFGDIAGLEDLKRTIRLQIVEPFLRPGFFSKFKKRAGGGVLLYGPPGCGKTMMAKAVATECNAQFVSVGISDVLNMYIGESERNLGAIFEKARHEKPCVLFFDEIDALAFSRSKAQSEHTRQVVNELLSQLDGFGNDNEGVLILAATNMPWDVDSAMKRPGRFSRQVFVPPPDEVARAYIIELNLRGIPHENIDAARVAALTPHFSGADIEGLVERAKDYVLDEYISSNQERNLIQADLLKAAQTTKASTLDWLRTAKNLVKYAGSDSSYSEVEDYLRRHKIS